MEGVSSFRLEKLASFLPQESLVSYITSYFFFFTFKREETESLVRELLLQAVLKLRTNVHNIKYTCKVNGCI